MINVCAEEPRLRIISLGAGVQSTTLALMAAHGEIGPMPDGAIFADTGWEPQPVYEHLRWLTTDNVLPFPVYILSNGDLRQNILTRHSERSERFLTVPYFTSGGGMGRRQCTSHYKIEPIQQKVRALLGLRPRQKTPKGLFAEMWLGISTDEMQRMKEAGTSYQRNRFPLIEARMSRRDCLRWLERNGYPTPPKSSCIGCPFHSDAMWRDMRDRDPTAWADAVLVDRKMREVPSKGMNELEFMHRSLKPLDQVDLSTPAERGQGEFGFLQECDGYCGT